MLTILWDADDVLNNLMWAWFHDEWLPTHPECNLQYADLTENPPDRVLGIAKRAYLESLDSYRLTCKGRSLEPNREILEWLTAYGANCRHGILTARPLESLPYVAEWSFRHFGPFVRLFGVVPVRLGSGVPAYDQDKGDFLQWLGRADVLVDDSEQNVEMAQRAGVRSVLFPQPWNSNRRTVAETLRLLTDVVVGAG
jgi:phosphoglycolate phosphatase-like HAD superfamily hydrolase